MNVFVLTTGRSGSMTFAKACKHMTNYTAGHETRRKMILRERLNFPDNHIEVDGRLAFYLGQIDNKYGDNAYYVHLRRNLHDTIQSCLPMAQSGTIKAWGRYIVISPEPDEKIIQDMLQNMTWNIESFLKNKSRVLRFDLENAHHDWPIFWEFIGAKGDYAGALEEWETKWNSTEMRADEKYRHKPFRV